MLLQISKTHEQKYGLIDDFCDGSLFKTHALFKKDPLALQIITYYDDVEICNPLGSHRGIRKLGKYIYMYIIILCIFVSALFYCTLGNILPRLRSTLKCIHLIACVMYPNLQKYGFEKVLQPFIDDVNKLTNVSYNS